MQPLEKDDVDDADVDDDDDVLRNTISNAQVQMFYTVHANMRPADVKCTRVYRSEGEFGATEAETLDNSTN